MGFPRQSTYNTAQGVLYKLHSMDVLSKDTRQKRVAIVKLAAYQSVSQHEISLAVQTPSNTAEGSEFEETSSAKSRHIVR